MIPGSYHNGFAPRDMEPRHPSLWVGCAASLYAGLGATGATLHDWAGKKLDGTNTGLGSTDWGVSAGKLCISYDGSTKYTSLPSTPALNFGTGDFSICQWIYMRSFSSIAITLGNDTNTARLWNFGPGAGVGGQVLQFNNIASGGVDAATGATTISLNAWHHIAAVRRSGVVTVYLDGNPDGSKTITQDYSTTSVIRIGQRQYPGFPDGFNGLVADTMVHARALTPNEIRLHASCLGVAYLPRRRSIPTVSASGRLLQMRRRAVAP